MRFFLYQEWFQDIYVCMYVMYVCICIYIYIYIYIYVYICKISDTTLYTTNYVRMNNGTMYLATMFGANAV